MVPTAPPVAAARAPLPVAADAATATKAHHTAPPHTALDTFLEWRTVQGKYESARTLFRNLHEDLSDARLSLQQFQSACSKHAPAIQLPMSMRLRLSDKANLTPVADSPAFYKAETDALRQLEVDTSKKAFDIIVAARERHIGHLHASTALPAFIAKEMQPYAKFVHLHCAKQRELLHLPAIVDDAPTGAASNDAAASASEPDGTFPAQSAIAHFEQTIRTDLTTWLSLQAQLAHDAGAKLAANRAEDSAAYEQVMAGAHNGETIAAVAARAAQNLLGPVRSELAALQRQRIAKSPAGPTARATATAASRGSSPHGRASKSPSTHGRASNSSQIASSRSHERPTLARSRSTSSKSQVDPAFFLQGMPSLPPRSNDRAHKRTRAIQEDDQLDVDDDCNMSDPSPDDNSSHRPRSVQRFKSRSDFPSGGTEATSSKRTTTGRWTCARGNHTIWCEMAPL